MTIHTAINLPDIVLSGDATFSLYRTYVIFTAQKIPVWTPLLRLGLRYYQGSKVTYTHSLIALVDLSEHVVYWYEMDFLSGGMTIYQSGYDTLQYEDYKLTLGYEEFHGGNTTETYTAVDVTTRLTNSTLDERWEKYLTDELITPFTLLRHLMPNNSNKVTWTCSGLTEALLTGEARKCYVNPKTPDQLYLSLTTH